MDVIWQELSAGMADGPQFARVLIRLGASILLGALIGFERERAGKAAGFRTHILVSLGTCTFVLASSGYGMNSDGMSRVIQGIVTGIGFIGAGAILKLDDRGVIRGLTTSAGIYMACAVGVATGLGEIGLAILVAIATAILLALVNLDRGIAEKAPGDE